MTIGLPTSSVTPPGSAVMDLYMVHGTSGAAAATRSKPLQSASHAAKMANAVEMSETAAPAQSAATASSGSNSPPLSLYHCSS